MSGPVVRVQDPCWRCGVRGDVDCAHRPGVGPPIGGARDRGAKPKISGGGQYRFDVRGKNGFNIGRAKRRFEPGWKA